MGYFGTPTYKFGGVHARSGVAIKKKIFKNGDHYEWGILPGAKFYCKWKTVGLNSGLKIYKTRSGAEGKFNSEMVTHGFTKEQRKMDSYISSNAAEHREGCRSYR
jgi:hypothetical protein